MIDIFELCNECLNFGRTCYGDREHECLNNIPNSRFIPKEKDSASVYNDQDVPNKTKVKGISHDNVNHPNHYTQGGIECIKAIEASMPPSGFQDYCKGNVLKYIWRFREKNGLEDLKKARVYLDWMIESMEKELQSEENKKDT